MKLITNNQKAILMLSYKDKTFCASPNCNNECGRKLFAEDKEKARIQGMPIASAYFCDIPGDVYQSIKSNEAPE
jgi:hypothetical protein